MSQAVALEPEDLHLALDAGVGVVVTVVGQGVPVVRREGDDPQDGSTLMLSPRLLPVSSLHPHTAAYNSCQTRPRGSNREFQRIRRRGIIVKKRAPLRRSPQRPPQAPLLPNNP